MDRFTPDKLADKLRSSAVVSSLRKVQSGLRRDSLASEDPKWKEVSAKLDFSPEELLQPAIVKARDPGTKFSFNCCVIHLSFCFLIFQILSLISSIIIFTL